MKCNKIGVSLGLALFMSACGNNAIQAVEDATNGKGSSGTTVSGGTGAASGTTAGVTTGSTASSTGTTAGSTGTGSTSTSGSVANPRPGATSSGSPASSGTVVSGVTLSAEEAKFLTLINQLRAQHGVAALQISPILQTTATSHSQYMDAADTLDHSEPAPNGSSGDRIYNAGGDFNSTGENIACGNQTAQDTYTQWVNSSGHLANMIAPDYQYIGIAEAGTDATEANHDCPYYWTTDFGGN